MGKNLVVIDKEETAFLKEIAVKNKRAKNNPDLVMLGVEISKAFYDKTNDKDFEEVTGLKK